MLNKDQRQLLIDVAKEAIKSHLNGEYKLKSITDVALMATHGVFVTLHLENKLRGCMGHVVSNTPLYHEVQVVSLKSAFEDPRFKPVGKEEVESIQIEISVISPFEKINSPNEVNIGVHGLVLQNGGRSGLFLPQVPIEQGWNLTTYVTELCRKAQCPISVLDEPKTELFRFTAEVFS